MNKMKEISFFSELIAGFEYDKSVDVYSLGAIYFFMLNGKDPRYQFDKWV